MASVQPMLRIDLDPAKPIPEIWAVIASVVQCNPGQEDPILRGIADMIDRRLKQLKGVEQGGKPVLQSDAEQKNK